MDSLLVTSHSSCERFTAEEVRKFLGLNDDYSNSSLSSSSDCEPDISDLSSDISGTQSESENNSSFTKKDKNYMKKPKNKIRLIP